MLQEFQEAVTLTSEESSGIPANHFVPKAACWVHGYLQKLSYEYSARETQVKHGGMADAHSPCQ